MGDFENGKLYNWIEDTKVIDKEIKVDLSKDEMLLPKEDLQEDFIITTESRKKESELSGKQEKVRKTLNESFGVFHNKAELLSEGKYYYLDKKGVQRQGSKSPSRMYMKPVVDGLKELDRLFDQEVNIKDKRKIEKAFLSASVACEKYLAKRRNPRSDEGKARWQMISDFYQQIEWESMRFSEIISAVEKKEYELNEGTKWVDILREVRTHVYEDGEDGINITKGGAGTSDVIIITDKEGKKKFFKQHEKIHENGFKGTLDSEQEKLDNELVSLKAFGASKAEIARGKERNEKRGQIISRLSLALEDSYQNNTLGFVELIQNIKATKKIANEEDKKAYLLQELKGSFGDHSYFCELVESLEDEYEDLKEEKNIKAPEKERILRESGLNYLLGIIDKIEKDYGAYTVSSKVARIKGDSELSKRNVATSRLAKTLGIGDLVVKSQMTEIIVNGVKMKGVMMEDAGGVHLKEAAIYARDNGKTLRYSPNAIKQLATLQLFDILCGQIDRNGGNYRVHLKEDDGTVYVDKVIAIDNDMSFGALTYNDIRSKGQNGIQELRNIEYKGRFKLPFIDINIVRTILALDAKRVSYQMADILSEMERDCLEDRINNLKNVLRSHATRKDNREMKLYQFDESWEDVEEQYQKKGKYEELSAFTYYKPELFGIQKPKMMNKPIDQR